MSVYQGGGALARVQAQPGIQNQTECLSNDSEVFIYNHPCIIVCSLGRMDNAHFPFDCAALALEFGTFHLGAKLNSYSLCGMS